MIAGRSTVQHNRDCAAAAASAVQYWYYSTGTQELRKHVTVIEPNKEFLSLGAAGSQLSCPFFGYEMLVDGSHGTIIIRSR